MFRTVTPILSIILSVLLFMFFVQPEYDEVVKIKRDLTDYSEASAKYAEFNKKLQKLIDEKNALNITDRERLEEFIPSEIDSTVLLVKLEKIAKQNNMLFGNIDADDDAGKELLKKSKKGDTETADAEGLVSLDISFAVIGTYTQFKDFLADLENSLTLFEIVDITLDKGGETQFQQYALTVRSFAMSNKNN